MLFRTLAALVWGTALVAHARPGQEGLFSVQSERLPIPDDFESELAHPFDVVEDYSAERTFFLSPPADAEKTIYKYLSDHPKYKLLTKLIDFSEDIVGVLDDPAARLTFFATPDWALKPRHRRKGHPPHGDPIPKDSSPVKSLMPHDMTDLTQIVSSVEALEQHPDHPDHEKHKKFLKKIIRAILSYHILPDALDSHQLGKNLTFPTTLSLPDGSLGGQPFRIRTGHALRSALTVNFFSKVFKADREARNGIIHGINHPLIPPPTIFQELFLAQSWFSSVTSALQRVGLTDELDLRYERGEDGEKGRVHGATVATFFAPSQRAFQVLPHKLQLFLFSPFGEKALKKLLQYHIIPGQVLHSDYTYAKESPEDDTHVGDIPDPQQWLEAQVGMLYEHENTDLEGYLHAHQGPPAAHSVRELPPRRSGLCPHRMPPEPLGSLGAQNVGSSVFVPLPSWPSPPPPWSTPSHPGRPVPKHDPIYTVNRTVDTLLKGQQLRIHIAQYKLTVPIPGHHKREVYRTRFLVNGIDVTVSDVVARNGAVHLIGKLLHPHRHSDKPHPQGDSVDEWEDWEDWFPQWANES